MVFVMRCHNHTPTLVIVPHLVIWALSHPLLLTGSETDLDSNRVILLNMEESKENHNEDTVAKEKESQNCELRCPIARNAAMLEELDEAEGKVAELLEVAAGALDELADIRSLDNKKVDEASKRFLDLVKDIHNCLVSKAKFIRNYRPYPRSVYGPRKELELLHEKAHFLRLELAHMAEKRPYEGSEGVGGSPPSLTGKDSASKVESPDALL